MFLRVTPVTGVGRALNFESLLLILLVRIISLNGSTKLPIDFPYHRLFQNFIVSLKCLNLVIIFLICSM